MIQVTWPRWPQCSKMLKTLKNLLLQNHWANCLETWGHVASGNVVLQSLYKSWTLVDLDLFYGKVKFGNLGFSIRKRVKTFDFSEHLQPVTWNQLKKWTHVSIEGQGHFLTLAQGHLHTKLKTCFSQKPLGQSKPNFIGKPFQVKGNENLSTWCCSHDQDGCHAHIW